MRGIVADRRVVDPAPTSAEMRAGGTSAPASATARVTTNGPGAINGTRGVLAIRAAVVTPAIPAIGVGGEAT